MSKINYKIIAENLEQIIKEKDKKIKELEEELKEIKDQFYRNELTPKDLEEILKSGYNEN